MIAPARIADDLGTIRALFGEYVESLGVDLGFQDIDAELAGLPGAYAAPHGVILLARDAAGSALGCVALRPRDDFRPDHTVCDHTVCEMKRLFVRPQARGIDLGRRLAAAVIDHAGGLGYRRMVLDTLASMATAHRLYHRLGFRPIKPYYDNPLPDTRYLGRDLGLG